MNEKFMEYIGNPVMCRLLLEIQTQGQSTAKKLAETYTDIPQATLYRYLNRMLKDEIIKIIEENKIRGTVEKVYALNIDLPAETQNMLDANSGEEYFQMFTQYMMELLREFQEYSEKKGIDIQNDGSGFSLVPLYLSIKELKEIGTSIQAIIKPFLANTSADGRKLRNIGIIITPPKE